MKLSGVEVHAKYRKEEVILRDDTEFVFKLEAVGDYDSFEEKYPRPQPPTINRKGVESPDLEDEDYKELVSEWAGWRINWMCVQTFQDVEWKTVTNEPETFENWETELGEAGFSYNEVGRLRNAILTVNGLMEPERIEAARENSSVGQEAEPAGV